MSIFRGGFGIATRTLFFRHLVYWYLQQSCCVILLVIEMCVDHWWRESLNQPNTNNWQVLYCVLYASWKSSQRQGQRSQKGKISLDDEQLRILIRTKTPAKNHLLIQNPKWSFLILVLTFSIDKARGRPRLARQKPSPSFITQEVGRRCDSISNIQFSWHIVSHAYCNTVIITNDITTLFGRFSLSLLYHITRIRSGRYFGLVNAAKLNETESWWHLIYSFPIDNLCFHGVLM